MFLRCNLLTACVLALGLGFSAPALAQEATGPSETTERYQSWTLRCVAVEDGSQRVCEIVQALSGSNGAVFAQTAIAAVKDEASGEAQVVIVFQLPQGVLLTTPPTLAQDAETEALITAPYVTCIRNACLARAELPAADFLALAGDVEGLVLRFMDQGGQRLAVEFSSAGLAPAFTRLLESL